MNVKICGNRFGEETLLHLKSLKKGLSTQSLIKKENGKLYLSAWDLTKNAKIDITDDLADGKAEGTFELNDKEYTYSVTGDEEINSILISDK